MKNITISNNEKGSNEAGYAELNLRMKADGGIELICEKYTKKHCNKRGNTALVIMQLSQHDKALIQQFLNNQ